MNVEKEDWINSNNQLYKSYPYWNDRKIEKAKIFHHIDKIESSKHLNDIFN